jgi:hypothetical protein
VTKQRGRTLRNDQEIVAALDDLDSELEEELLSSAGSIRDLSRWIGTELQLGEHKWNLFFLDIIE